MPRKKQESMLLALLTPERVCIGVLVLILVGTIASNTGLLNFGPTPTGDDGTGDDDDSTSTEDRYTVRVKWGFVPIMQIDGPEWIDAQIYAYPEDMFVDAASLSLENVWFDTMNRVTQNFALGDHVLIYIVDSSGWNFNLVANAAEHSKYLLEVGVDLIADLYPTDTDQDWGDFWLEWVLL